MLNAVALFFDQQGVSTDAGRMQEHESFSSKNIGNEIFFFVTTFFSIQVGACVFILTLILIVPAKVVETGP